MQISKASLSSDCRLQFAYMKEELLVIVDQQATVNTFSALVHTARHTTRVKCTRRYLTNLQRRKSIEGMFSKGDEVVTRQPYRKVWLDHLLSRDRKIYCYLLYLFGAILKTCK